VEAKVEARNYEERDQECPPSSEDEADNPETYDENDDSGLKHGFHANIRPGGFPKPPLPLLGTRARGPTLGGGRHPPPAAIDATAAIRTHPCRMRTNFSSSVVSPP
jgi:hypothetical protein